jgi:hypothetical protein
VQQQAAIGGEGGELARQQLDRLCQDGGYVALARGVAAGANPKRQQRGRAGGQGKAYSRPEPLRRAGEGVVYDGILGQTDRLGC